MKRSTLVLLSLISLTFTGCVERKLTLTSNPPGALVYMNNREIGRTPVETDFLWYGNYDVQVRKEGYQTLNEPQRLRAPWWQFPPIDLIAELMPWHPTDRQTLNFTLTESKASDTSAEVLIDRAGELKGKLESPPRR